MMEVLYLRYSKRISSAKGMRTSHVKKIFISILLSITIFYPPKSWGRGHESGLYGTTEHGLLRLKQLDSLDCHNEQCLTTTMKSLCLLRSSFILHGHDRQPTLLLRIDASIHLDVEYTTIDTYTTKRSRGSYPFSHFSSMYARPIGRS